MTSERPAAPAAAAIPADWNPRRDPPLDFPDLEPFEMTPADYRTLGFLSGLEVHQQLLTRGKLFCRCPAGRRVTRVDAEVLRHMRPTLSELGEYDGCALMEFKTKKEIVYLLERGSVCTYEMDDTPPFPIDEEAIRLALEVALLFHLNLVSELHVMRKQYLDGSIPTGFQRTAMLGLAGEIPFRVPALGVDRPLRIRQFSLEEDSCREVSDVGHRITFRTDRLGTPLIETVTEPDFLTPLEVQAGGRLLARVAQASGKVRRGAGAARQDTNVSVAGGRRVEIKGVGHHRGLPLLTHVEAFRQLNLLRIRAELLRRGVTAAQLPVPGPGLPWEGAAGVVDATSTLRRCDYMPIRDALDRRESVVALRLPGFEGLLTRRTQPGVTFAREFAGRVRVIACLTGRPFLIHSDLADYGPSQAEWRSLHKAVGAERGDAVVVLWGAAADVATAVREVYLRARDALEGVPAETRQSHPDGTNGFERILPGADRMYPDTDTPPKAIPDAWVHEITARLPERPWDREDRYRVLGLDGALAAALACAPPAAALFDAAEPPAGAHARRVAGALLKLPPRRLRRMGAMPDPGPERLKALVAALARGDFRPEAFDRALERALRQPALAVGDIVAAFRPRAGDDAELDGLVRATAAAAAREARSPDAGARLRWALGRVTPALLGRVEPGVIRERLEAALRGIPVEAVP
ncbi:MAG: Glu-tRNA(Gln) amidotransferase subunit GatE [Candidatus Eisenbacteria bacterium]|nr:Glu-tRNA(Gln) amidotransferase subunit GatE [Candidatus Eisenbacteria bacterium]